MRLKHGLGAITPPYITRRKGRKKGLGSTLFFFTLTHDLCFLIQKSIRKSILRYKNPGDSSPNDENCARGATCPKVSRPLLTLTLMYYDKFKIIIMDNGFITDHNLYPKIELIKIH